MFNANEFVAMYKLPWLFAFWNAKLCTKKVVTDFFCFVLSALVTQSNGIFNGIFLSVIRIVFNLFTISEWIVIENIIIISQCKYLSPMYLLQDHYNSTKKLKAMSMECVTLQWMNWLFEHKHILVTVSLLFLCLLLFAGKNNGPILNIVKMICHTLHMPKVCGNSIWRT